MDFKKLFKVACVFIILISVQGNSLAATFHGTIYEWYTFKPLNNSIVEVNSTPQQSFVATNAEYSFNLTPGTYRISAKYIEENIVIYKTEENITIFDDGEYVYDLLLFPVYQEDLLNQEDFENIDLNIGEGQTQSQANSENTILIFALLVLCILLLAGHLVKKDKRNHPEKAAYFPGKTQTISAPELYASGPDISEPENFTYAPYALHNVEEDMSGTKAVRQGMKLPEDSKISQSEEIPDSLSSDWPETPEGSLPDDLKEVMNLIRASGNRITQRELRKKSPYSESKVSLMLSDLEERGLIEKFKRGRGNIIRIPDEEVLKQRESMEKKE
ncbi:MAG: MarR family transcriptional regulator [Euryarchaeota archaeon]|nr:MarR family transcriptional regulator [Euryarchaeota archaeon]